MDNTGWIKLHRSIFDNEFYFSEPFTKSQAWVDILLLANHKEGSFINRGIRVEVKRGEVCRTVENLAERWRWSRGKVDRFLNALELSNQIVTQKNNVTTTISILNYDKYQQDSKPEVKASSKSNGHQTVNQTDTNKNEKNNKEEKNNIEVLIGQFIEMRKSIKKPMTPKAIDMFRTKLERISGGREEVKIAIIEKSIFNSWQDIYELKHDDMKEIIKKTKKPLTTDQLNTLSPEEIRAYNEDL